MMGKGQRIFIFVAIFGGGLVLLVALTLIFLTFTLNSQPRVTAQALVDDVTVREYVALPDDNAYPASVAVGPDGRIYTGSFDTGAVYEIDPDGTVRVLPDTREFFGSVSGIAVDADGVLYVLDRIESNPRSAGGVIWRLEPGNAPQEWNVINDEQGFVSPNDIIAVDGDIYVTDRGRAEVWRFSDDRDNAIFWRVPEDAIERAGTLPTGLAYDPVNDALIVTTSEINKIYRVDLATATGEIIFEYDGSGAFDGVTVAPDGTIYVAALEGGVIEIRDGELTLLATNFRGSSDVVYTGNRLIVTNFDSAALVTPGLSPQLPFALDVIDLSARSTEPSA